MGKPRPVPRPTQVKVGYHTFTIIWMSNKEWASAHEDGEDAAAMRHVEGWIRMRVHKHASLQHLRETLVHEILHAIWSTTSLTHQRWAKEDDPEEHIVGMTSGALLFVLQNNPEVLRWLLIDEEE